MWKLHSPLLTAALLFAGMTQAAGPLPQEDLARDAWAELERGELIPASEQAPWDFPELLANPLDKDPFVLDARFGGSGTIHDGFGTTTVFPLRSTAKNGHRVIRLDDGGAIVAALVPALGATTSPETFNIGLARYDADGTRVKWTLGASQYTDANKNWFVYPNTSTSPFIAIQDLQVFGGYLWLLADRRYSTTDHDAAVIKVKLDGSAANQFYALGSGRNEAGAGLVFESSLIEDRMLFVGRRVDADGLYSVVLKRYTVPAGNGSPTLDTGFGTNGEKSLRFNACGAAGNQPCSTAARQVAYVPASAVLNGSTVIYLAGDMRLSSTELHTFVYKLNMSGNLDTSWGSNGTSRSVLDVGGRRNNELYGLTIGDATCSAGPPPLYPLTCQYQLFLTVAAQSADTSCGWDIAVAKLKTNGYYQSGFGNGGWVGGPSAGGGTGLCIAGRSIRPAAAVLDGERLVVVGNEAWTPMFPAGSPTTYSGVLKTYDTTTGALRFADTYSTAGRDDTWFRWVAKADADSVYVAGTVTGPTYVTTSRFRLDRIFGNGFQKP